MRKRLLSILCLIIILLIPTSVEAASPISYVGSDLTNTQTTACKTWLGIDDIKYFTPMQASSIWGDTFTTPETDCIALSSLNTLSLSAYQKNGSATLDKLGYIDFLLSLGIYQGDFKVINTSDTMSLAESLQSYKDLQNYSIPPQRLTDVKSEFSLYTKTVLESKSTANTSNMFYLLEKYAMSDPQTALATHTIVDMSATRSHITLSKDLKDALYTWEYNYIVDGNKWSEFFREPTLQTGNAGSISISYQQLTTLPNANSNTVFGNKLGALATFVIAILLVGTLIYSRKHKNNTQ